MLSEWFCRLAKGNWFSKQLCRGCHSIRASRNEQFMKNHPLTAPHFLLHWPSLLPFAYLLWVCLGLRLNKLWVNFKLVLIVSPWVALKSQAREQVPWLLCPFPLYMLLQLFINIFSLNLSKLKLSVFFILHQGNIKHLEQSNHLFQPRFTSRKSATITSCLAQTKLQEAAGEILITKGRRSPGPTVSSCCRAREADGECSWCWEFSVVDWNFL